jgi:erythromycin esterase
MKRGRIPLGALGLIVPAVFFRVPAKSLAGTLAGNQPAPAPAAAMKDVIDNWIECGAISFTLDDPETFHPAVDRLATALAGEVELLGIGEPLHGGEEFLRLRNRLFQRLVEEHNFSAIALESCFVRGRRANEYIQGSGPDSYEDARKAGFSHNFGDLEANRELVEWMRQYNAGPAQTVRLRFYGFDSPTEMTGTDSPRRILNFVLDYLAAVDLALGRKHREQIEPLLGRDADWENPAALFDPEKSIGLSPEASSLRTAVEDPISDLLVRRPGLAAESGGDRCSEALQYARVARQLLNYHAELARKSDDRTSRLLGIRDAMMADNLVYIAARERERGRVLIFAHNSHLKRGKMTWQLGSELCQWWPAGAQLNEILGPRYAVIGTALGASGENGIGTAEPGSLERQLAAVAGPALFIPTYLGAKLPAGRLSRLPVRSGSRKNPSYFPLTPKSFTDFDWLAFLDSASYTRGAPTLSDPDAAPEPPAP